MTLTAAKKLRIIIKLYPGVAQLVARMVRDHEAVGSNPATRTMRSVLIGSEYPVTGTPHFLFPILYRNLCRGVAGCYAFSRFHDNIGLQDFLAVRHFKGTDAVIEDHDPLIGNAALLDRRIKVNVVNQLTDHTFVIVVALV